MKDWIGNTDEMIGRIRPKARYDIAVVAVAIILGGAIVWAAYFLRPTYPSFEFVPNSEAGVFVGDRRFGDVALCRWDGKAVTCSATDSGMDAKVRDWEKMDAPAP